MNPSFVKLDAQALSDDLTRLAFAAEKFFSDFQYIADELGELESRAKRAETLLLRNHPIPGVDHDQVLETLSRWIYDLRRPDIAVLQLANVAMAKCCESLASQSVLTVSPENDTDCLKGVTMMDAARLLSDGFEKPAKETKERWLRQSKHPRPSPIGCDPKHLQKPMFRPSELVRFIEAVEGTSPAHSSELLEKLLRISREPSPKPSRNTTGSK